MSFSDVSGCMLSHAGEGSDGLRTPAGASTSLGMCPVLTRSHLTRTPSIGSRCGPQTPQCPPPLPYF